MNEPENPASSGAPQSPPSKPVRFRFEKSASFRSIYVMSAWGRINGNGDIVMSLYQEMAPLPLSATYEQFADGNWKMGYQKLEFPHDHQGVRQIEADIVLTMGSAIKLRDGLSQMIKMLEKRGIKPTAY
jgi:hypothetical protein